jgi:hypothetical protein
VDIKLWQSYVLFVLIKLKILFADDVGWFLKINQPCLNQTITVLVGDTTKLHTLFQLYLFVFVGL